MISFAQADSNPNQRALKAALLSTLPGLGQLFNRRLDKALAFFLVDLANIAFVAVLLGAKIPFVDLNTEQWVQHLSSWRAGTAPFILVQLMMLSYVIYSQFDAYRDAQNIAQLGRKPELSLSHTACASYILHLSTIFAICFLILFKITPEVHPDLTQISLSFELEQPATADKAKDPGQDANLPENTNGENAHIKDRPKDEINASSPSAEMSASQQETSADKNAAAEEKQTIASKQIISPELKQMPKEVASDGASKTAKETIKKPDEASKDEKSTPSDPEKTAVPKKADSTKVPDIEQINSVKQLLAQVPAGSTPKGLSTQVEDSNSPKTASASSDGTTGNGNKGNNGNSGDSGNALSAGNKGNTGSNNAVQTTARPAAADGGATTPSTFEGQPIASIGATSNDPFAYNQGTASSNDNQSAANNATTGGSGPSMLGFMDSALSTDPDMRQLWSEMSGNISRYVKDHPLQGQGVAINTFTLNQFGQPTNMKISPAQSPLAKSITETLLNMPKVVPPTKQSDKMFFQVKSSNDGNQTFISLEVNSQPNQINSESLSDFKYQVDLQAYLKGIKKAIYSSWKPPVQEGLKPVMVGFKVTTDGTVSNQHVVQSSGDPRMDRAALHAALSVTKWSQPPAGTAEDLDVCMVVQKCRACEAEQAKAKQNANRNLPAGIHIETQLPPPPQGIGPNPYQHIHRGGAFIVNPAFSNSGVNNNNASGHSPDPPASYPQ